MSTGEPPWYNQMLESIRIGPALDPMPRRDLMLPPPVAEAALQTRIRELEVKIAAIKGLVNETSWDKKTRHISERIGDILGGAK